MPNTQKDYQKFSLFELFEHFPLTIPIKTWSTEDSSLSLGGSASLPLTEATQFSLVLKGTSEGLG